MTREDARQAATDLLLNPDSDKWRESNAPPTVLAGYVSFRKAGRHLDAQALLSAAVRHLQRHSWHYFLIEFLLGRINEQDLLAEAAKFDKLTEVHWFIGTKFLYDARIEDAEKHLLWLLDHGTKSSPHYDL